MEKMEPLEEHKDLEWMYRDTSKTIDHEEYLLGRSVDSGVIPYDPQKNHVEHECIPPSLRDLRAVGDIEQIDAARKLQEDPLFEINRQEIEARKRALQNPVKLKKQLEIVKSRRKSSSSEDNLDKKLVAKLSKLKNSLSLNFHRSVKKKKKSKKKEKCTTSDSDDSEINQRRCKKSTRSKYKEYNEKKYKKKIDIKLKKKKQKRSKSNSDLEDLKSQEYVKKSKLKDKQDMYNEIEDKNEKKTKESKMNKVEVKYYRRRSDSDDSDIVQRNYGLVKADGSKIEQVVNKFIKKTSKTPERKISWVKPEKNKFTEEEKEKKRQEMMSNAEWRDDIRRQSEKNKISSDKPELNYDLGAEFLKKQLLKSTNYDSVESRIKSNMNNIQRSRKDMDRNFARRH